MKKVMDIVSDGKRPLIAVSSQDSLQRAAMLMSKHHLGALPVVSSSKSVGGILTRHDILSAAADGIMLEDALAGDFMSTELVSIPETETVEYAVELMRRAGVKHVPVTRGVEVVGVASWGPMVYALEEQTRSELGLLQEYVFGR